MHEKQHTIVSNLLRYANQIRRQIGERQRAIEYIDTAGDDEANNGVGFKVLVKIGMLVELHLDPSDDAHFKIICKLRALMEAEITALDLKYAQLDPIHELTRDA